MSKEKKDEKSIEELAKELLEKEIENLQKRKEELEKEIADLEKKKETYQVPARAYLQPSDKSISDPTGSLLDLDCSNPMNFDRRAYLPYHLDWW